MYERFPNFRYVLLTGIVIYRATIQNKNSVRIKNQHTVPRKILKYNYQILKKLLYRTADSLC